MSEALSYQVTLDMPHEEAIERVTAVLKDNGFGVLTRIDIHQAFKEKLGEDFRDYTILGACNPPLAHLALTAQPEVGLLLPCNVTVETDPSGKSLVRLINAKQMLAMPGLDVDDTLREVASGADVGLRRATQTLKEGS